MFQFRLVSLLIVIAVAAFGWILTCGAWRLDREVERVGPLEPREFAELTLITLGTGGAHENPARRGPSTAVGLGHDVLLVDAGRASADALRLAGIPVAQPDTIYLTNLLAENTIGLDDLLLVGWIEGRETPLRVVGPPGTAALASALSSAHRAGIEARAGALGIRSPRPSFDVVEIRHGFSEQVGDLTIRAAALPGGPLAAFAYRFEANGRSAVIAGTGWAPEALIELARGANLLTHEARFVPTPELAEEVGIEADPQRLRREAFEHTSIDQVGALAQRAGVETLVLVRLRPPPVFDLQISSVVDDRFSGRIVIAKDGDEIRP